MINTPDVSVIVPVYNVEKWLRKCVDSILSQTYVDFELILINDGSKDRSLEICREYELTVDISEYRLFLSGIRPGSCIYVKSVRHIPSVRFGLWDSRIGMWLQCFVTPL